MKTLHLLTSHAWGGLELYVVQLAKKILEAGMETAIYCIQNSKVDSEAQKLNIPVLHAYKQARISPKDILKVRKILKQEKFDVIHTHTRQDVWLGSLVKRSFKIRLIHSLYMSAPAKKDFLHRFIYSQIDAITSSSEILNERIKQNYPIAPEKVHLLRYGRDQNDYEKNKEEALFLRKLWNTKENEIVFATMCRLDSGKGVREIGESLLYLSEQIKKQIKIWIIGEPTLAYTNASGEAVYEEQSLELYQWLTNFVQQQTGKIELIPFQKNIKPYLYAMDVFILGTYKETYSLSVLDAMGEGVPVIGTNSGGTPEQVKHLERGYLIEPKNSQSIANAITYYVENIKNIKKHGLLANLWVKEEHNWNDCIKKLQLLYTSK